MMATSSNGYSDDFGPNVANILAQATRVIRGRIPQQVRGELRAAVKAGVLGHLKKDGLKPEIFFHPSHKNGAIERQQREADYSIGLIKQVFAPAAHGPMERNEGGWYTHGCGQWVHDELAPCSVCHNRNALS